jgi:DNA-binding response OmpR family regulator
MRKPVVLLAERDADLRRRLFSLLLCQGFDVIESPSITGILRALRQKRSLDLLIVSASLEGVGDGVDVARLVRLCERKPTVILTAADSSVELANAARGAGVASYFTPPFSYEDLLASVYRFS